MSFILKIEHILYCSSLSNLALTQLNAACVILRILRSEACLVKCIVTQQKLNYSFKCNIWTDFGDLNGVFEFELFRGQWDEKTVDTAGEEISGEELSRLNILVGKKPHCGYYKAELLAAVFRILSVSKN